MLAAQKPLVIRPQSLYLEPISSCNLHCRLCYANVINGADKRVLDADKLLDFVHRYLAATDPPIDVYWCGTGEAFLHRDFPRMVNRLLDYGEEVEQTIQTNGAVRRLREFASLERLDFNVSIDGPKPFHEWHRGRGTYDPIIGFCREAVDMGCRTLTVRCLLTWDNIHHLDEFHAELIERIGPGVQLRVRAPYTSGVLREARKTALAIVQHDFEEDRAIPPDEAQRIFAEKYQGRYELDEADVVENYLSVNTYGVHTCCHGVIRIGPMDEDIATLRKRMDESEWQCKSCSMYPCQ
jgi:sulfatase maturation enzyme AslB (radical SAM superfamily)